LQQYDACFVVPSSAVNYREKEKDSLVYVRQGEKFVSKPVQTGLSAHGEAVILNGVEEGELIALRNPFETRKLYLPDFSKGGTQQGRGPGGRGGGGMPPEMMRMMMGGGDMMRGGGGRR
jgi:hypothetical protein